TGMGGGTFNGSTLFLGTTVTAANTTNFINVTTGAAVTVNAGKTLTLSRGRQTAGGVMTVYGTVNTPYGYESAGQLTVPAGGLITNATSPIVLGGGSTSFVGSVANPGGKIDLGGQQLIVRGGLLVTNAGSFGSGNGVRNGTTVADYGALVKGTGPYQSVLTQNGGQHFPGHSPATSQVAHLTLE